MKKYFLALILTFTTVHTALAIPPPDVLISAIQSVMQFLGVAVVFMISLFYLIHDFLKNMWALHKKNIIIFVIFLIFIILYFIYQEYFGVDNYISLDPRIRKP